MPREQNLNPSMKSAHGMIGVIADPSEHAVISEFFELFKTPWEFYQSHKRYDVLLCACDGQIAATAKLVLIYAGKRIHVDHEYEIETGVQRRSTCIISHQGIRIPIYGD